MSTLQTIPSKSSPPAPRPPRKLHFIHLAILAFILACAAFVRFDHLTRTGLWGDEYQGLFLATGRGDAVLNIPTGVIVHSPPPVGFDHAPSINHIWSTLDSTVHPPLFIIVLRLWVDCFGHSDFSVRAMACVFGLLGIPLLFEAVRLLRGPWHALLAAAMMAFAPTQIDFAQLARPYTMVAFLCLILYLVLIRIDRDGISTAKWIILSGTTFAVAMTHYFALGNIAAAAVYVAIHFDGKTRTRTLAAIFAPLFLFAAIWGPFFWHARSITQFWLHSDVKPAFQLAPFAFQVLNIPERLTFGPFPGFQWGLIIALVVLVFLVPPFFFRSKSFIWYYWVIGSIVPPLAVDLLTRGVHMLVGIDKYVYLASPGIYGLLAAAMCGWAVAAAICFGIAAFGVARVQQGPPFTWSSDLGIEDHRAQARFLSTHVQPGDLVILPAVWTFNSGQLNEASFNYFIIAHYAGEWKTPVLLLTTPLTPAAEKQFPQFHHIWVAGSSLAAAQRLLPAHPLIDVHAATFRDSVWAIQ